MMKWMLLGFVAVLCLSAAALASPSHMSRGHGSRDQQIDEDLIRELESILAQEIDAIENEKRDGEKKSYEKPPAWWVNSQPASRTLRTLSRVSKPLRQQMVRRLAREEDVLNTLDAMPDSEAVLRSVVALNLDSRADIHPVCDQTIDCNDRVFINNKEYRKPNGTCNNIDNPYWGSMNVQHRRLQEPVYPNGIWRIVTQGENRVDLPQPRAVSNKVCKTAAKGNDIPTNTQNVSIALFQFLQFLDHDFASTTEGPVPGSRDCCTDDRGFCMAITMNEADDESFPAGYCMDARRSFTFLRFCNGSLMQNQITAVTSYIDGSNVYGSSQEEQDALRTFVGGQLLVSNEDFPPKHPDPSSVSCSETGADGKFCFQCGDSRCNVFPTLATAHTLFVREHNRIAKFFSDNFSSWNDEKIFQITRKIVGAQMQAIVYNEVLPILLDSDEITKWGLDDTYSYDDTVDASMFSAFLLAFRIGHTMIPDTLDINSETYNATFLFNTPTSFLFKDHYAMANTLQHYVVTTPVKQPDATVSDSARNTLFYDGTDRFDLSSLNIARSREWGTPSFTVYKSYCGYGETTSWSDLLTTHDQAMIDILNDVYNDPRDIDLFPGIVSEAKVGTSFLGKVGSCLIAKQFRDLKFGDRFFYQNEDETVGFTAEQRIEIEKATYAGIICLNTNLATVPGNAFKTNSDTLTCADYNLESSSSRLDLTKWKDE